MPRYRCSRCHPACVCWPHDLSDKELNEESGFPALVGYLRGDVLAGSERLQRRSVALDLVSVAEHLRLALQSELSALVKPGRHTAVDRRAGGREGTGRRVAAAIRPVAGHAQRWRERL